MTDAEAAFEKDMAAPKSRQASALQMDHDIERHIQATLHGENPDREEFKGRLGRSSGPESERAAIRRRESQEFAK